MPNYMTEEILVNDVPVVPMRLSSRQAKHVYELMRGTCRKDVVIEWKTYATENAGGRFVEVSYLVKRCFAGS